MALAQTTRPNEGYSRPGHHMIVFGFGVLFIGTLVHTVGTVTRGWIIDPDKNYNYGLFTANNQVTGSLITVRVFTIMAIVFGIATLTLTAVYLRISVFSTRRKIATLILVIGIGAGGSSLIGALTFALEYYFLITVTDTNYSFVLCIVGGVLLATGSITTFVGARQHLRATQMSMNRIIIRNRQASTLSSQPIPYQAADTSDSHVWHTQMYTEPPPAYNQLELAALPPIKQEPPSYAEAVQWYPKA